MGTVGWLLVVAVGIALGFSVGRLWPGSAAKLTELQRERDAAREDLETYRQDVSGHFERTAELFDKVTADYRGLYEHLATSARRLGAIKGESVQAPPLAEPEKRRLAEPAPVKAPEPFIAEEQRAEAEAQPVEAGEPPVEAGEQDLEAEKLVEPEAADLHQARDYPPAANDEPEQPETPEELAEGENQEQPAKSR
jgi:uncharacterized membrane-anchored protein YhcB (DUF1043 family)